MSTILDIFGSKTFDKNKMKQLLSVEVYEKYKAAVRDLSPLELQTANEIATAVKIRIVKVIPLSGSLARI